jgi:hypothetical protein
MRRYDMPLIDPPEAFVANAEIDHAEAVAIEAGCPTTSCPNLNVCEVCGDYICPDHTRDATTCVDVGDHHDGCVDNCQACVNERALELAGGV